MTISEPRLYTDEEVAVILREAAQSADSPAEIRAHSSGLSLEQIKAAAADVGLDPSLVERVALRIAQGDSESLLERAAGGPIHHREAIHLATPTSEKMSARLLSAIRAAVEVPGQGHADAAGFSWHAWDRGNRVSVTAHEDSQGTRVQVLVNRTSVMVLTVWASAFAIVMPILILVPDQSINPYLALAAIPAGVLAVARAFWKSSTRSVRERTARLLDAVRDASPADGDKEGTPEPPR